MSKSCAVKDFSMCVLDEEFDLDKLFSQGDFHGENTEDETQKKLTEDLKKLTVCEKTPRN